MQRPPHDPGDKNGVDETTDAWDTVEWLIHNVPNTNGKLGLLAHPMMPGRQSWLRSIRIRR